MKTLVQQEHFTLEIPNMRLKQVSRARRKNGFFSKESENKVNKQKNNYEKQYALKVDRNVPNTRKDIIHVIQENMNESDIISKGSFNADEHELINKKNNNNTKYMWLDKKSACPLKNGLYYVTDGKNVGVSFFDTEKRVFFMLKDLHLLYWSTMSVTLLR